jgi:murein DD-endopeptidase MepM/ murein hydrolase activator NlpD
MKKWMGFLLLCLPGFSGAMVLPTSVPVPGGVAVIELGQYPTSPKVTFDGHPVAVVESAPQRWTAVVGLPLNQKPGKATLTVQNAHPVPFTIKEKTYPKQSIQIKNPRLFKPNAADLKRIDLEKKKFESILSLWTPQETLDWSLQMPLAGTPPVTGVFGAQRIINGTPKAPHRGLDLAAATGTSVVSVASGTVVEVSEYFYSGKIVIIEHGQGFKTLYCHLNSTQVAVGQTIHKGATIGTVGSTGRATGPHLHFGVSLNHVLVDPLIFFSKV